MEVKSSSESESLAFNCLQLEITQVATVARFKATCPEPPSLSGIPMFCSGVKGENSPFLEHLPEASPYRRKG